MDPHLWKLRNESAELAQQRWRTRGAGQKPQSLTLICSPIAPQDAYGRSNVIPGRRLTVPR
jgi:hypothetical protein